MSVQLQIGPLFTKTGGIQIRCGSDIFEIDLNEAKRLMQGLEKAILKSEDHQWRCSENK